MNSHGASIAYQVDRIKLILCSIKQTFQPVIKSSRAVLQNKSRVDKRYEKTRSKKSRKPFLLLIDGTTLLKVRNRRYFFNTRTEKNHATNMP